MERIMALSDLPREGWKNKNGTAERACNCGSWRDHWLKFSKAGMWPQICAVDGCNNIAEVGAHVYHPQVGGERIAPMCRSCNKAVDAFTLKGRTPLPLANVSETCGRPQEDTRGSLYL